MEKNKRKIYGLLVISLASNHSVRLSFRDLFQFLGILTIYTDFKGNQKLAKRIVINSDIQFTGYS